MGTGGPQALRHHVDPVSRGCPFDCEFCNITFAIRTLPRQDICANHRELDGLYQLGWREPVFFVDEPDCNKSI